jgi:protein tyrosine phosphatase
MDNSDNYPVLIHCYHGTGRAEMYSALYRIEYEKFTNEAHVKEWEHYWNLVLLMMELKENTLRHTNKKRIR